MEEPVHPNEVNLKDGSFLVHLARKAVEEKLYHNKIVKPPENTPKYMYRPGMVFTTIEKKVSSGHYMLRGCIGFLSPIYALVEATIRSAIEAAINDPRFPPMKPDELDNVVFEVTVLSIPIEIKETKPEKIMEQIVIGRDGLVIEKGFFKGTLLPMVPIEYCWDTETFLAETCLKAGLEPSCWLDRNTKIYRYEGRAFKEKDPGGEVFERDLVNEYREKCLEHDT